MPAAPEASKIIGQEREKKKIKQWKQCNAINKKMQRDLKKKKKSESTIKSNCELQHGFAPSPQLWHG